MVARTLAFGLVLLFVLLVQSVLGPALTVAGVRPDLVLLTVVGLAMQEGPGTGVRYGFAAGLALDLLGGQVQLVGVSALVLLLVGYGAGMTRPYLTGSDLAGQVSVSAAAAVLAVCAQGLLSFLLGSATSGVVALLRGALGAGVYAALLAPFVCRAVQWVARRFPPATPAG